MRIDPAPNRKTSPFFSRLQVRLVALILFVLLPALLLALSATAAQNSAALEAASQQALTLARLTAANHEQIVSGTERLLIALAQIPEVKNGETAACDALFVQLREQYASYSNFYSVDTNGDTICTGIPDNRVNIADRQWFKRAQEVEGFSISDYSLGAVTGLPVITLSYPILDEAGNKKYYVSAPLNLEWMNTFIDSSEFPSNATLTAFDGNGTILYRYPDGESWIGKGYPNAELVSKIVTDRMGITEAKGLESVQRLYGFAPLDNNASAFIVVGLSQESVVAKSQAALAQSLIGLLIVGAGTLFIALYGAERFLGRPIQTLVGATINLSKGDLAARVDTHSLGETEELIELGNAFNSMAASLERQHDELETKVQERTRELSIIADASATLASSLDYESTLKTVTHLVVPDLADWCAIDVLEDGVLKRLATAHIDPEKVAWAEELHHRYPPDPNSKTGVYEIVRSREAVLYREITEPMIRAAVKDEEQYQIIRDLGFVSSIAAPLIARDRVLGVLSLVSATPGHHYNDDDLKLAKEIARRAAITIDRAYLYHDMYEQREQLKVTISSIGDAVIATNIDGEIVFINPVAQQITGWIESDALGRPLAEVFNIVSEETREMVESPFDKVVSEGKIVGLANHTVLIARDGSETPIDDSGAPIFDEGGGLIGVILVFRDIRERRSNEQRINLLLKLSAAFSQALTPNQIAEVIVTQGREALEANVGTVCLLDDQGETLEMINRRGLSQENFEKYRFTSLSLAGPLNDAVRTGEMIWIENLEAYLTRYPQFADIVKRNGSRSTICLPLKVNERVIGGVSLSFPFEKRRTDSEEVFFNALANQCAQSLERARLYEVEQSIRELAQGAQQRLAFLAEANAILTSSLDTRITLNQITRLIVPEKADWTHIDLLDGNGGIERLAVRHIQPEKEIGLYELNRLFPLDLEASSGAGSVIRTGKAEFVSEVAEGAMEKYAQSEEHLRLLKAFDTRSYMIIPLIAHGKIFGSITFASSTPHYFALEDLSLMEEFAQRAALSIANAELYQLEQKSRTFADQNFQRVNRLQAATVALLEALTRKQVSEVIVEHTVNAMGASSAILAGWLENERMLEVLETRGYDPEIFRFQRYIPLRNASSHVVKSLETHFPVWVETAATPFKDILPKGTGEQSDEMWVILPLYNQERILGVLILSVPNAVGQDMGERAFLVTMSQQCIQALERSELYEKSKELAALQERQRLARDLHDAVSQVLFSSTTIAESIPRMWERDTDKALGYLAQVVTLNRAAMAEMRSLLLELRPETIIRTNLSQLLEQILRAAKGRKKIETELIIETDESPLPSEVQVAMYRIVQEGVNNSIKHSEAKQITLTLTISDGTAVLIIADDGQGFEVAQSTSGLGLYTMRERAVAVGMDFELQSEPGKGTQIRISWNTTEAN